MSGKSYRRLPLICTQEETLQKISRCKEEIKEEVTNLIIVGPFLVSSQTMAVEYVNTSALSAAAHIQAQIIFQLNLSHLGKTEIL